MIKKFLPEQKTPKREKKLYERAWIKLNACFMG